MTGNVERIEVIAVDRKIDDNVRMSTDLNNPYAPPSEVTEPPWSLAPDTEFLFNDELIAAVGTLTLPKVCVLTGVRTGLVERTSTLHATPQWLKAVPAIVLALLIPGIMFFVMNVARVPPPSAGAWNFVMAIVLIAAFAIPFLRRRTLKLRWYLAQSEIDRLKREQKQWSLVLAAVGLFVIVLAIANRSSIPAMLTIVLVTLVLILRVHLAPLLVSTGCYRDLVVVKGFRWPFIHQLRTMIERFEGRDRGSVSEKASRDEHSSMSAFSS